MNSNEKFLIDLKNKIKDTGLISKLDIISLENSIYDKLITNKLNINSFSTEDSSINSKEVLAILEEELIEKKDENKRYLTTNIFSKVEASPNINLELFISELKETDKDLLVVKDSLEEKINIFLTTSFLKNIINGLEVCEIDGVFYKVGSIPLDKIGDMETSNLFFLCGNKEDEYILIKSWLNSICNIIEVYEDDDKYSYFKSIFKEIFNIITKFFKLNSVYLKNFSCDDENGNTYDIYEWAKGEYNKLADSYAYDNKGNSILEIVILVIAFFLIDYTRVKEKLFTKLFEYIDINFKLVEDHSDSVVGMKDLLDIFLSYEKIVYLLSLFFNEYSLLEKKLEYDRINEFD